VCSIITADLAHQFAGQDDFYIFLYFDAELPFAQQLEHKLSLNKNGIIHFLGKEIEKARKDFIEWFQSDSFDENSAKTIIQNLFQDVTSEAPAASMTENRIANAIQLIHSSLHNEISLENIASGVFLSESRFAHLFKEQIGIPFRRYVLWCRMQAALKAVMQSQSFTQAAYEGGFADVAHLSRTFTEMFGVSPSDVLKQ
jgi:AraC-like DNA-binding protein